MPLPPGVTLQPIDGGPTYYSGAGYTYAHAAGWDDPSFFPIGLWLAPMRTQADADRWLDLGLNTGFTVTADSDLSLFGANGLWLVNDGSGGTLGPPSSAGAETTGLLAFDEPTTMSDWEAALSGLSNTVQDARFWWLNNTWNFVAFGGISPVASSAAVMATTVTTPDTTKAGLGLQSIDTYWIAGSTSGALTTPLGDILGLGHAATADQTRRGSWYGDMVDYQRAYWTPAGKAPVLQFVENGGPYTQDTVAADYTTPPEMNWAVWSAIIHGARLICYFNHSFAGPAISDDNFAQSYYQSVQSGQSTSIYAQAKATNALVSQLAPAINSPTALGYVTVSPAASTFAGVDLLAKYTGSDFYIFTATRESGTATNIAATFTLCYGYSGPVTVVGESRTVQAVDGVFTDTFAQASTVHIYQIAAPMTLLTNSFEGGSSGTTITAGNSGGASGNAFDTVDDSPAYSNTHAATGTLSAKLSAGTTNQAMWWTGSLTGTSVPQVWFRLYGYLSAYPTSSPTIVEPRYSGGSAAFVVQESNGQLTFADQSATAVFRTTTALPIGAWWRIEGFITGSASAGQVELKVFLSPNSATPDETKTSGTSVNTGGAITAMRYGQVMEFGGSGVDMWVDNLGASTSGYIGPVPSGGGGRRRNFPFAAVLSAASR